MAIAELAILLAAIAVPVAIIFLTVLAALFVFSKLKDRNDHQAQADIKMRLWVQPVASFLPAHHSAGVEDSSLGNAFSDSRTGVGGCGWFGSDGLFNCWGLRDSHGADNADDGNTSKHSKCPGWAETGANHEASCNRADDSAETAEAGTPRNASSACRGIKVVGRQTVSQNLGSQHANAGDDDWDVRQEHVVGKRQYQIGRASCRERVEGSE